MPAAHEPTDETRELVEALASFGNTQEEICLIVGVSENTLRKHYATELDQGTVKANALVAGKLFQTATQGKGKDALTAQIFWLKTRAGWKETNVNEHVGKNGAPLAPTIIFGNHPNSPKAPPVTEYEGDEDANGHTIQ